MPGIFGATLARLGIRCVDRHSFDVSENHNREEG